MTEVKVYIVVETVPYEGSTVRGVFFTRDAADAFAAKLYRDEGDYWSFEVEEWRDGEVR